MSAPGGSPLLDLDSLMPAGASSAGNQRKDAGTSVPACPGQKAIPKALTGQGKANNGAAFGDSVPAVPVVPVKNAGIDPVSARKYAVSPAAVALLLAWCERMAIDREGTADALQSLSEQPPGEQVARWSQACQNAGIAPWRIWHLPSPATGYECTGCRHFDSFVDSVEGTRRRFHWRCALGYPVYELWRWSGLTLIAPPDCSRYERYAVPDRSG